MEKDGLLELVIRKTHRVPLLEGKQGNGSAVARQLDAALMDAGWKLSGDLLARLSGLSPATVLDYGVRILAVARREAGDHVRHNAYFRDFPANVPDTVEFWVQCLTEAFAISDTEGIGALAMGVSGEVAMNLLALPAYGSYQHTFEDMVAAHGALILSAGDRMTVLSGGDDLSTEATALYLALASGTVPLSEDDTAALADLALACADGEQPQSIPVRESRAVINRVRVAARKPVLADTVTDVLRLAAVLSDGDVSLATPGRLRSFTRPERRILLAALDQVVSASPAKLGDVNARSEQWKRLGERLHPHEHPQYPQAADVFAVARGDKRAPSLASRIESAFTAKDVREAAGLLSIAPGMFFRSADRLLRTAGNSSDETRILEAAEKCAPDASCRVLLSLREHLQNRVMPTDVSRVFASRSAQATTGADTRAPLDEKPVRQLTDLLDAEIASRLNFAGSVVIEPDMTGVALPLSGKTFPGGLGVLPRGSVTVISGEILRFFCYWREAQQRTDYDLSALLLNGQYADAQHVSWTAYHAGTYATYSGDLTGAPDGATEFIDIRLGAVPRQFILPQVYIYSGESFTQAAEAFFGFMIRSQHQEGAPFEARTVRMKSDLRGEGRIALPLAFMRGDDGKWRAKWLHLYMKGHPSFNMVEGAQVSASQLTRAIVERDYLRVGYLADLLRGKGVSVTPWDGTVPDEAVTFIGMSRPEGMPEGSRVITPANLADLIPA